MIAVVTGMIATHPVGGVAWDYGQYLLGLHELGFEVYYLEDTGFPSYSFDPAIDGYVEDPRDGLEFLRESLGVLNPAFLNCWHFRDYRGQTHGLSLDEIRGVVAKADILLNVSGSCILREPYRACRRRVLIDTDPGFNHFVNYPRRDKMARVTWDEGFRGHDRFFTYATRLGEADCPLDNFGLEWLPTRPPVVMSCWQAKPPGEAWTTIMMWKNYGKSISHGGHSYGSKEREFTRFEPVPQNVDSNFEIAVNYQKKHEPPLERWKERGWSVKDGRIVSRTAETYREYVESSRGEFSVAKHVYVATRCGWFSCRSVCYLAAGRPVVVQDTGFRGQVPTEAGLLAFSTYEEAVGALKRVEADYVAHQRAAVELARSVFSSDRVLKEMMERIF
jgi:hypothetical protein